MQRLSDDAKIWIFGISPRLDDTHATTLLRQVDAFLENWDAHGHPVLSGRDLIDGSFLVIAAEKSSETSGCSIDRLFRVIQDTERNAKVSMLDANRIFYRDEAGTVHAATRADFRSLATADTVVCDVTSTRLGDLRSGAWQQRVADSPYARLLAR